MAGVLSTYGANHTLDGSASIPATLYVKLHTGNPGAAGTSNAAGTTVRKSFTRTASSAGASSNVADIAWTTLSANETLSHISIWDNVSAGNCWFVGALGSSQAVTTSDTYTIPAGDLDIAFTVWS